MNASRVAATIALLAALTLAVFAPAAEAKPGTKLRVYPSAYGDVIWNSNKQAIYLFTKEKGSKSRCYGDCAKAWPPVYSNGAPVAGRGIDEDLIGTTERRGGRKQITYGGHPLYYYNEPRGKIFCQNVFQFGGLWLVVAPNGKAVR